MSEYSYIGVVADLVDGDKYLVRSNDCPIFEGNIVEFNFNGNRPLAEVLRAAFLRIGGDEETMLAAFGDIYDVEKIYACAWDKKKEEEKNGN